MLARVNRTMIVEVLRAGGAMSRQQIIEATGLSSATVIRLTTALLNEQAIQLAGNIPSTGGRPSLLYRYAGNARTAAVAQIHADGVTGALVDFDGQVVHRVAQPLPPRTTANPAEEWAGQWEALRDVLDRLIATGLDRGTPTAALGVAVPGTVTSGGVVQPMAQIGWVGMPLGDLLAGAYDLPAVVENDANALALGEYARGSQAENLVAILIQEGVGAGILIDGRVHRGSRAEAGEIGYLLVGRGAFGSFFEGVGALERRLSSASLQRELERRLGPLPAEATPSVGWVLQRAADGDEAILDLATEILDVLAMGVAALVTVLDPETVVLGDGFGPVELVVEQLTSRLHNRIIHVPPILPAALGADAVVVGVAELAALSANGFAYFEGS